MIFYTFRLNVVHVRGKMWQISACHPWLKDELELKKYVATVTQISALDATEMEWLCWHMGHTVDVHKQYYRMQDSAIQLSKVSRLLLRVGSCKGAELKGKALQDITENGLYLLYNFFNNREKNHRYLKPQFPREQYIDFHEHAKNSFRNN